MFFLFQFLQYAVQAHGAAMTTISTEKSFQIPVMSVSILRPALLEEMENYSK